MTALLGGPSPTSHHAVLKRHRHRGPRRCPICGRFSLYKIGDLMKWLHGLRELPPLEPRYNIAPTQTVPAARAIEDVPSVRELVPMRWGYVPHWAKDATDAPLLINARSESLHEKPAFQDALAHRRCLLPADGFYEWETLKGSKRPHYYRMTDGSVFGFAGLWSTWVRPDGSAVDTCTILTCPPNEVVSPVHDRMPVILESRHYDAWLDPANEDTDALRALLRPYPAAEMETNPVTPKVNRTDHDDPDCVRPGGQQSLF